MANNTITTSLGKGNGYLVATTAANPDTLMVYGVPVGMFDIPDEWFSVTGGYLLPYLNFIWLSSIVVLSASAVSGITTIRPLKVILTN